MAEINMSCVSSVGASYSRSRDTIEITADVPDGLGGMMEVLEIELGVKEAESLAMEIVNAVRESRKLR